MGWGAISIQESSYKALWENERALRLRAEESLRSYSTLLRKLAFAINGRRLDEILLKDPNALDRWGPTEWESYFSSIQIPRSDYSETKIKELEAEIERLRKEIARLKGERMANIQNVTVSADVERVSFPRRPPSGWKLSIRHWERSCYIFEALCEGLSLRMEILEKVGKTLGISPSSGSLQRLLDKLINLSYLKYEVFNFDSRRIGVLSWGQEGLKLLAALGIKAAQQEHEILRNSHEHQAGEEVHTILLLLTAYHARKRGLSAQVLPDGETDILVGGEHVEVERKHGEKEKRMRKWKRNREKNGGRVCVVTDTEQTMKELLTNEIAPPFRATNIEYLNSSEGGPFWELER